MLAIDNGTAYLTVSLCPYTDKPSVSHSSVRYRGRKVIDYRAIGGATELPNDGNLFEYDAVVYYGEQSQFNPETHGFDRIPLPAEPTDLCFTAFGPSYFDTGGFDSNVAVIPKDALARALAELRQH